MTDIGIAAPLIDGHGNSNYAPCWTGIHLCGSTPDGEQPYTAANIPAPSQADAIMAFAAAKSLAECAKDEADFCCDLMISGDHVEDFWTNRQLWPVILAEIARLSPQPTRKDRA